MDEPLSNLDAKLRTSMRAEITKLHKDVGGTFVYVTHDQVEAMTMGTMIALMRKGVVQQFGRPRDIYTNPANTYVARFIGTPPMNLVKATIEGGQLRVGEATFPIPAHLAPLVVGGRQEVLVGVRPEDLTIAPQESTGGARRRSRPRRAHRRRVPDCCQAQACRDRACGRRGGSGADWHDGDDTWL